MLSFFKKGDTIQGGTLIKEIRYIESKKLAISAPPLIFPIKVILNTWMAPDLNAKQYANS